jgi:anti-sigma regulatory factor (Ser/Thr protein kinase)
VRQLARGLGHDAGLEADRLDDFELAVGEVIANTVLHGGGHGEVGLWTDSDRVVCEVRDAGRLVDPLAGRRDPAMAVGSGRGLWIVNQLCDLVQIRVFRAGTTLRLHIERNHRYPK